MKSVFYLKNVEEQISKHFKLYRSIFKECGKEEQANGVILFDVLKEKVRVRNLNDFYGDYKKRVPVLWEYFCLVDVNAKKKKKKHMQEDIENGETTFLILHRTYVLRLFHLKTKIAKIVIAKKMVKYVFTANNIILY